MYYFNLYYTIFLNIKQDIGRQKLPSDLIYKLIFAVDIRAQNALNAIVCL